MAKKVSFDPTSFNYGANRKPSRGGKAGGKKGKAPHAMGKRPFVPNAQGRKGGFGGGSV